MDISRRQLVALGAAGAAGAVVGKVATSESSANAVERMGGIHIYAPAKVVKPEAVKGFPHTFAVTLWGSDDALSGMGWGGTLDRNDVNDAANATIFQCVYGATGSVQGDVVKVKGLMLFSGNAEDQGMFVLIEGNLTNGFVRIIDSSSVLGDEIFLEAQGVVARI